MGMNIKSEEAHRLVKKLVQLTGESQTAAITEAVRQRLELIRSQKGLGLANRLVQIGQECASHLRKPFSSIEHGDLLYNEKGLPE
jgi:antitoxin VapB